jgi:DNA/RNA endonuclease YhcR with UshA esterase domain
VRNTLKRVTIFIMFVIVVPLFAQSEKKIPASQAAQHVGETATVCGYVASTRYLSSSRSKPTFLNFDKPYPNEDFTVVIWPEDRAKFGEPETKFLHKNVCATGEITLYRGSPQIIAKNAAQIKEQ